MRGHIEFRSTILLRVRREFRSDDGGSRAGIGLALATFLLAGFYGEGHSGPSVSVHPHNLGFETAPVGALGKFSGIKIQSIGRSPLHIESAVLGGEHPENFFLADRACSGETLPAGGECNIVVGMRPKVDGPFSATLTIRDDGPDSPQVINLNGGGAGRADLVIIPNSLEFPAQLVGGASAPSDILVRNTGTAAVTLGPPGLGKGSGKDFQVGQECASARLRPGEECRFSVTFVPQDGGPRNAVVSMTDSTGDPPHSIPLHGSGTIPLSAGGWQPERLDFGTEETGGTEEILQSQLNSIGTVPLVLSTATLAGAHASDFNLSADQCSGKTLQPGEGCAVSVRFLPRDQGSHVAQLVYSANTAAGSLALPLSGTVVPPRLPAVHIDPPALDFGEQDRRRKGSLQTVRVISVGQAPLRVSGTSVSGKNAQSFLVRGSTCQTVLLAPRQFCEVQIVFAPRPSLFFASRSAASEQAELQVFDDAAGSPQRVLLQGTSHSRPAPAPALRTEPPELNFPNQLLGTQSEPLTVTLWNQGQETAEIGPASVQDSTLGGAVFQTNRGNFFILEDRCSRAALPPLGHCPIRVVFRPVSAGGLRATLTVPDARSGSLQSVALSGAGVAQQGWCCLDPNRSQLYPMDGNTCRQRKGTFFLNEAQGRRYCMTHLF